MEDELVLLAQTAGTTLVALMTTDGFQRTKEVVLDLWRRVRPSEAGEVAEQMETTRAALMRARAEGDEEHELEFVGWWQEHLAKLFASEPSAAETLQKVLDEIATNDSAVNPCGIGSIQITAKAHDHARIFQAGRDQHIVER